MTISSIVLFLALVCTLVLMFFSVRLVSRPEESTPSALNRFLLVALRVAIGWHFFIEAAEKLHDPSWSSEGYLRESTGPLAPVFRELAGDRLVEQLTLRIEKDEEGKEKKILSTELTSRWEAYVDAVANFYRFDASQQQRAEQILEQTKATAKTWLSSRERKIRRPTEAEDAPPLWDNWTMPQRLKKYEELKEKIRVIESDELGRRKEGEEHWLAAKGRAAKWRAGLQKDLDVMNRELRRGLLGLLLEIAGKDLPAEAVTKTSGGKAINYRAKLEAAVAAIRKKHEAMAIPPDVEWDRVFAHQQKLDQDLLFAHQLIFSELRQAELFDKLEEQTRLIVQHTIERKSNPAATYDLVPFSPGKPISAWGLLDLSDFLVKWGLLIVGLCLILGLFTRTFCVIGAVYLFMFYLAMPALPGWPQSPRSEGHYLFINKNIIEMLALLALATLRTGWWAGIDGLIRAFRAKPEAREAEEPVGAV